MTNLEILVRRLVKMPIETLWLEFKENNCDKDMIGESISALANAAAYCDKSKAYFIWGVNDVTHDIVGTTFNPLTKKTGNEPIENWLRTLLSENADFSFEVGNIENKTVVALIITRATERTVMFKKTEYIRVGSVTKKLNDVPNMKAQLWDRLRSTRFEDLPALQDLLIQDVVSLLDCTVYFDLLHEPRPLEDEGIVYYFSEDNLIICQDDGRYTITNLGAILLAKRLSAFPTVSRKAVRVIQYRGENRLEVIREIPGGKGYAVGFEGLLQFIEALLPATEIIDNGIRRTELPYPSIAIRESVANALIHQDFSVRGTGPLIEIFNNRIEITNPGLPLVDVFRIVDNPPRSRNEKLAAIMRRFHVCEESGTGWDKIVFSSETLHLPAPKINVYEDSIRVTLRAAIPFGDLLMEDKLWACYMHACIRYVEGKQLNNTSLRERFGLDDNYMSQISRLIKAAVASNLIKPFDADTAPRYMSYIPIWA